MKKLYFTLLAATLLLCACGGNANRESGNGGDTIRLKYAKLLTMVRYDDHTEVSIADPWNKGKILHKYSIGKPVQRCVVSTSVHCSLLEMLGRQQNVCGICDAQFIKQEWIKKGIASGRITDCGNSMQPTIEKIMQSRPDAIIMSPFQNSGGYGKLDKLGVTIIEAADYMETSPLARAEWMKLYGILFGAEAEADSLFAEVERNYLELKGKAAMRDSRPTVMMDLITGGTWYVPGGQSTIGQLIDDAAGKYVWADDRNSGSLELSFETVLSKASEADVWLLRHDGSVASLEKLAAQHNGNNRFRAFVTNNVWGCNTTSSMFYEETPFRPDLLLKDFIDILHDGSTAAPRYFQRLSN